MKRASFSRIPQLIQFFWGKMQKHYLSVLFVQSIFNIERSQVDDGNLKIIHFGYLAFVAISNLFSGRFCCRCGESKGFLLSDV